MSLTTSCLILGVCAIICASQPVEKLPVLRQLPSEALFRENKEFVLECSTEEKEADIKYKWLKDGKPLSLSNDITQKDKEGTLVFKNPTKKDEGSYKCLGESALGVASTRVVKLKRAYIVTPKPVLQSHKAVEGKTFKLECKIPDSYPEPEIIWRTESPNAKDDVQGQRFTVSDEGDLYMSNVTKEDTGKKYICLAKSSLLDTEVVLAGHVLENVVPSKGGDNEVVQQYVTKDSTLKAGESVYLYCIYGGNPLAHPDWFKDGVDVNNSPSDRVTRYNKSVGKRLLIKEVLLEDQGAYTCVVDNEVGRPQKHSFNIKVVSAPKFVKQPEPKLIAKQGQDVTVQCEILGVPEPKIEWTYNTGSIKDSGRITKLPSEQNISKSALVIKNVQKSDGGYYGCNGTNEYGDVYAETLLYVQ